MGPSHTRLEPTLLGRAFDALGHGVAVFVDGELRGCNPRARELLVGASWPADWPPPPREGTVEADGLRVVALGDGAVLVELLEPWRFRALHDPLTGLPNRAMLQEELARHPEAAVAVLDIDGFKELNDREGHAAGDAVLRELARRLRSAVRTGDTVARLGGDELAVVLPGAGGAELQAIGARLVAAAGRAGVSVSVGVAAGPEALGKADAAMYVAKRDGGRRAAVEG